MDRARLNEIIEKHKKWLNNEDGGECADLSYSDLRYSNLSHSDMRHSDLRGSDMSHSDLRGSDMSHSDLNHSNMIHSNLRYSNLIHSDMRHSDLRYSNLSHSDMRHSDLRGSNLDYSGWPLWCGSLDVHIDDRIARQLLYHLMRPCLVSPDVSEDFKRALFTPELIAEANAFHRAEECGLIEMPYEEENHGQSN